MEHTLCTDSCVFLASEQLLTREAVYGKQLLHGEAWNGFNALLLEVVSCCAIRIMTVEGVRGFVDLFQDPNQIFSV